MAARDLQIANEGSAIHEHVTISIGVATQLPRREGTAESLLAAADAALYRAKAAGRDRVETIPLEQAFPLTMPR